MKCAMYTQQITHHVLIDITKCRFINNVFLHYTVLCYSCMRSRTIKYKSKDLSCT